MRERVDDALHLRTMAEIAHLSPYHFARTFRQVTGIPPGEFLCALRLQRAKELLLTSNLGVGEVCFEVGYNSVGTFTTRFTRLVGLPPGRVRRLPEELGSTLERKREDEPGLPDNHADADPDAHPCAGVCFRIVGPAPEGALIFVGLFPGPIPQGRPVAGTVLTAPGTHLLSPAPDGSYHLMAAALPRSDDPLRYLLPGSALRVGRAMSPVVVRAGRCAGCVDVTLRPPRNTDPPVLVALPAFLLERQRYRAQ